MQSLLYSNFMAFKVKLDCEIYANKITCNLNMVSFYIRSVQKAFFLVHLLLCQLISHHYSVDEVVLKITSQQSIYFEHLTIHDGSCQATDHMN